MSERIVVHDSVYAQIKTLADKRGTTMKEAVRDVFKEAEYDV